MLRQLLPGVLALWNSPQFQDLARPILVLSSVSAMFWMLARSAGLLVWLVKSLLPEEVSALLTILYSMILAVGYATMMFYTALLGQWHPSLVWRECCGFIFMYVMLGVTFTDRATRRLVPHAKPSFFLGLGAFVFLAVVPALARQPALIESHRVLELFAAGGWGLVMTALTVSLMAWSLASRAASELAFSLSPLLYQLGLIKAPVLRLSLERSADGAPARRVAKMASPRRSMAALAVLLAAAGAAAHGWPRLRAQALALGPALRSRAQSPEAAAAAAQLKRVLPEVSFTAVRTLPRQGPMADLARPVFRGLLQAPSQTDRLLAAAALDRVDSAFRVSPEELLGTQAATVASCSRSGRTFRLLERCLPGDDPAQTRTYWIADERGVHFTGIGPGDIQPLAGSSSCAAGAYASWGGTLLLAFTEAGPAGAATRHLWLSAYDPIRAEVLGASRVGESAAGDFRIEAAEDGVTWADAPGSSATAACRGDCGRVRGVPALAMATEPLIEFRSAAVRGLALRTAPEPALTFARSGLQRYYGDLAAFERAFRFDPGAGFLNRWYRSARRADGRDCVSAALDPTLPGWQDPDAWTCLSP